MIEALKRLKNSVLSYVENAITDEIFDSWSPKKQKQWIKDHPNSKYASKDYKSSNKRSNKQTKSPTLKSKTLDKKQLSEIKKKVDKLWNVSDIEDMVSYELRGKDVDTKILPNGTYQITWMSQDGYDGEELKEALLDQMSENYKKGNPIKVQLRHVNRNDWHGSNKDYDIYNFKVTPGGVSMNETKALQKVKDDPDNIRYIKNPSEKVQLEAVKHSSSAIEYIKNPSEKVQLEAVKDSGFVIRYIKNPSEKVQLEAVKNSGYAISYIENPSEKVQLEALKQTPLCFKDLKKPCKKAVEYINQLEKEKGLTLEDMERIDDLNMVDELYEEDIKNISKNVKFLKKSGDKEALKHYVGVLKEELKELKARIKTLKKSDRNNNEWDWPYRGSPRLYELSPAKVFKAYDKINEALKKLNS